MVNEHITIALGLGGRVLAGGLGFQDVHIVATCHHIDGKRITFMGGFHCCTVLSSVANFHSISEQDAIHIDLGTPSALNYAQLH